MDIQQLKASHCIGQVAGRYVQLTYRERKATGRCPFHDDHTPSLRIDLDRQSYICFACGAQGDVIHFIRQIEQCSFAEAVRYLTGGTQPPVQAGGGRQGGRAPAPSTKTRKPQLTPAMVAANEQFLSLLMPAVAGHPGLAATWLSFETGHAPHLLPAAWKQMAGRLIFPIRDHTGQLAGFAARRLTDTAGSKEAKYINSAASAGFHKSGILYGFYQAREAIAKTGCVFLTEGYKDTLAMHAAGFTHSVGLGGTAFTDEQLALLLPVAKLFYILCDADPAGREAAARIATRLAREPVACRIVHLPGGHDPDSLFRQLGPADFTRYIQLLTTPPAAAETALLATCLHVPSYRIEQEENSYPFAAYLFRLMQTDLPAFSHPGYREVLELLAGGRPANQLPEGLQLITGYALQECPQPLPPEEAIVYYTEIQLTREIGLLAKSLSRPTGPKERRELLAGLEAQRKLLGELAVSYRRSAVILPDRYS